MDCKKRGISPFVVQCFVTAGVSLNMAGLGLVLGLATGLLPQLRQPHSQIPIDDTSASWIASLPGFAIIAGTSIVPGIMSTFGRRTANLCSLAVSVVGWLCVMFSNTVYFLITARFIQGVGMGMIATLGPVLIGEYTSPKNRGLFLMTISVSISLGVFIIQTLGTYLPWKICALICIGIILFNTLIVVFSPESPTFLVDKERYDECRKVFRYLRGNEEDEELEKMITARMMAMKEQGSEEQSIKDQILTKFEQLKEISKKKEFYKPIIIMFHVYLMAQWSGVNILTSYTTDLFQKVVGEDVGIDIPLMVVIVGIHRILGNLVGMVLIKTLRRRVMLFSIIGLNTVALLTTAAYTYLDYLKLLPFDEPIVGVLLIHIHMFSVATGAIPLCFVLAGELYPMEYKSLCGGICMLFFSLNLFISTKTVFFFFNVWGVHGCYCLYSGLLVYCLVVVGVLLPETKDKTLQEIEEELKGKTLSPNK